MVGVTFLNVLPARNPVPSEALAAADLAMYEAKALCLGVVVVRP